MPDTHDLMEPFRRGEADAIAFVARLARFMVGERGYFIPRAEREDVVQEILIHVYRAVSSPAFRLQHGFEAFVRTVAHRRCVDWMRRRQPSESLNPDSASLLAPGPETAVISRESNERALQVLRSLGNSCLELIRLRYRDDLSYHEIAGRLGRTEHGVRSQMYKCIQRAKALFAASAED